MKKLPSKLKNKFEVNLDDTINSGQVFLWKKINSKWYGINGKNILTLKEKLDTKNKKQYDFFRFDDDFQEIKRKLSKDVVLRKAIERFPGMRILRQDPFQCYISFIVSSNSNIPNIQTRLQKLCMTFGEKRIKNGQEFFCELCVLRQVCVPSPPELSRNGQALSYQPLKDHTLQPFLESNSGTVP